MKEYEFKDIAALAITIKHVVEDMVDHLEDPSDNVPLGVVLTGIKAHTAAVCILKELNEAHATKFTICPISEDEKGDK